MITKEHSAFRNSLSLRSAPCAWLLLITLCLATLTLWITAYWPVALFEISVLLIAGIAVATGRTPASGTYFPFAALTLVVLWGCFQMLTGHTVNRFATERATFQWMTWSALYYAGVSFLQGEALAKFLRTVIVWFGFAVAVEAILQAYLSPGIVFGLFPTGYHEFVMGPIVYHTHFAAIVETILPIALFLALSDVRKSNIFLGVSALLITAVVVSASRGGLIIACAEVFVVLILFRKKNPQSGRKIGYLVLALMGVTAILILIVGIETTWARFYSEALTAGRVQFARSTLHMIAVHPAIGWGLGCWPAVYPAFATFDPGAIVNQAHCDWLQWTAEGGLPVGVAMLSLAVWAVRPAIRSIWGIGLIAVLAHAVFDYPFSRPAVGAWPILVLSMVANSQNIPGNPISAQRLRRESMETGD
jgi:hypothetical protein